METTGGKSTAPEDLIEPGPEAPPTRLMVLGLTHRDGSLRASEIYRVAEAVGLSDDQIRGCLRRLVAEELFTREGEGRDAQYLATTTGLSVLESTKQRHLLAYAQDAAGRGWDRRWRLAGFAIPERARSARDQFRDRLLALGAAPIHNGLYVSPHRWEVEVEAEADRLNIGEFVSQWSTDDLVVGGGKRSTRTRCTTLAVGRGGRPIPRIYRNLPRDSANPASNALSRPENFRSRFPPRGASHCHSLQPVF
jgi:predicted transcriptional regulator